MYEYKVIPAPRTAPRSKGAKTTGERFSSALQVELNEMGAKGWSYVRAESLPVDERHGLLRKVVEEVHTVLIFRRPLTAHSDTEAAATHNRPRFFAQKEQKEPETAGAPALGTATEAGGTVTPELRAEKEPAEEKPAKPAKKPAVRTRKKAAK